jgi:hypothetical protein
MNPSDKVDDFLAKAGAQWRAGQQSAPEPDLDRITGQTGRRPRYWAPALAAASVLVIATAALVVLPGKEKPAADPIQTLATGNSTDQAGLLVRNGDRVEVDGQVIAAPGKPVLYCAPHAKIAIGYLPGKEPAPACPAGLEVKLTGVDLDRLSSPSTVKGVRSGQAHLTGIWIDRAIAVQDQSAPRPGTPDYRLPQVPCKEPPGGWRPGNANEPISPAVAAFVKARLDQLAEPWIGWPAAAKAAPSMNPSGPPEGPSVLVIEVAKGDPATIRKALEPLVTGNLCVTRGRFSQADSKRTSDAVAALNLRVLGISIIAGGMGNKQVGVDLLVVDEKAFAEFTKIGLDKLELTPAVVPVR